jgi:ABC-type nitrate/sulfonate/bicarbonate transport system substrate-binding protein
MKTIKTMCKTTALLLVIVLALAGCGGGAGNEGPQGAASTENSGTDGGENKAQNLKPVTVVLDWTPNTNHTGLYVAKNQGFYEEEGLAVEIVQPGQAGADQMVAGGNAQFGVSNQESVTYARIQDVPIVSLAAIIQHNTSGFASPVSKNIKTPKDFEGKTYGGWGSPVEAAVLQSLMNTVGADFNKLEIVNVGNTDFFTAVQRDIDFFWIFYAWTGVEAELRNEEINMIYLTDYSEKLDYYTPVLITSEAMIADDPETVEAFMRATAKGYQFAIDHPEQAAEILISMEPDLDAELVKASQRWLSPRYQDDAPRWGEQKREVWQNFSDWMLEHNLLEKELDVDAAFTNEFLPEQ